MQTSGSVFPFTVLTSLQLKHETDGPERDIKLLCISWVSDETEKEAFAFHESFFNKLPLVKKFL